MDTPPEERFDRLTRLAKTLFGTEMALVSLVDTDRQWFKSRQGLDASETPRDISFCGHAILGSDILEVTDARQDPRFADNPLVVGPPHIRFYAGAPLKAASGHRVGTLCIIDSKPRQLTLRERNMLDDLAGCVEEELHRIDLIRQGHRLEQANRMGELITRAQSEFIGSIDWRQSFNTLLDEILVLTGSEYGFISEVLRTAGGDPYLKTYAITNIAWDAATREFYEANAPTGMEFFNLKTLFGVALTSGDAVIANNPAQDPRRGGLPDGHPPLNAFLGLPVHYGQEMVAMVGLANRSGGYDQALLDFLRPLTATLGQLVDAARTRQALEKQEAHIRHLLGNLPGTVYRCANDASWSMHFISDYVHPLTGYPASDFLPAQGGTRTFASLIHPDDATMVNDSVQNDLRNQRGFRIEYRILHADGQYRWVQELGRGVFQQDGSLLYLDGFIWDVTDRKRLEQMKDEFISTVSHELRTPLTSISAALGLLQGGALGPLQDKQRELITIAHRNSHRLSLLINDLLDMEKLAAGEMPFNIQPQYLLPLVQEALEANRTYGYERKVSLTLKPDSPDVSVAVDSQRLMQVMSNLLSNAIKFSPENGQVEIGISLADNSARISVVDRGPGIPAAFQDRIFQKFAQADASDSRRQGGTGLGLAITRELVERMGGQIGFLSQEGSGTTFFVDLPMATPLNEVAA
ncbi:MAG: GAF domain-containing protein [Gammaproteobacteria bacterium]|nr:GAF domain-containing protein [Gammaproteobacteria bacterium]